MLKKITGMINLREDVDILNTNFMVNRKLIEELAGEYKDEIQKLKEIKEYQTDFLADFKQNMMSMGKIRGQMEQELESMRSMKFEMQREMLKKFERELNSLFEGFKKDITIDKQGYERIKQQIEAAAQNLFILHGEVAKLMEISSQIKRQDFDLQKYHETLDKQDKHKVELLKKIDDYERMMSKMKRQ